MIVDLTDGVPEVHVSVNKFNSLHFSVYSGPEIIYSRPRPRGQV